MSTVAQFRTLDWGMENCTIEIVLPPTTTDTTTLKQIHDPSTLSLWLLDPSGELDVKRLSYSTKPARVASLGRLTVTSGMNVTSMGFICPRDAFPTIEVECASAQCAVDVIHTGRSEGGAYTYTSLASADPILYDRPLSSAGAERILIIFQSTGLRPCPSCVCILPSRYARRCLLGCYSVPYSCTPPRRRRCVGCYMFSA